MASNARGQIGSMPGRGARFFAQFRLMAMGDPEEDEDEEEERKKQREDNDEGDEDWEDEDEDEEEPLRVARRAKRVTGGG